MKNKNAQKMKMDLSTSTFKTIAVIFGILLLAAWIYAMLNMNSGIRGGF